MTTEAPPLSLHLLASPQLLRDGAPVHVGSRKALAILAWLALEGGSARARLTGLLWPEADAAAGRRNLRRELFRLRELGAPLREAADGTLALDAGLEVDALRLLGDDHLPDGGGLAFDGLDGVGSAELDAWLQRWRDRLAAHQAQALDRQAAACEGRGDLAAALALRQRGWAADPLQEAAALHVMRLKAALGDRAGALQAYQRLLEALRDELDIAPSPPVQAFARVLRDSGGGTVPAGAAPPSAADVGLHPPRDSAATVAAGPGLPPVVPFVPRTAVQRQVEAAWARGQRVYLHGPAGAGKTRLASELAAARGPWLRVACEPQDTELPYASIVRLLRALRDSAPDVATPDWVRRELAQLMPELGAPPQAPPTEEARQRLLAAVAEAWRLLMADNFSAVVLDDWHWGDPASVELWARLDAAQAPDEARVAWIVAYRSAQLPAAALARQRADLDSGRAVAVPLEGLDEAEVLALTQRLSGAPGGRLFSQRLHRATEGNPFFLLETLRHLFEQGLLSADADGWSTPFDEHTESYAELPVPASVRAAVQGRARALGPTVQRLVEVASLCSGEIGLRLMAGATGMAEEQVVAAFEHAEAARLLEPTGEGWRFAHDLVRQSLAQGLTAARRRLLHERLATRLELMGAAPALVALHWEAAGRRRDALRWRVAAAEAAVRVHAPADALAQYARSLDDGAEGVDAARIHRAVAQIHARLLDHAAADEALAAAVAAATAGTATDPAVAAGEALAAQLARVDHLRETDRVSESLALLDALEPDLVGAAAPLRAQALGARASVLLRTGRHNEGERLFEQAVDLLSGHAHARAQQGELLLEHTRLCLRRGDLHKAGLLARRAVALHESIDAPIALAQALVLTGVVALYAGETEAARANLGRARALAQRCGHVPTQRAAILNLVKLHTDQGETAAAVALLDEGEQLAPAFEHRRAALAFRSARYFVHFLRGEVEAARAAAERLLAFADGAAVPNASVGPHALDVFERIGACVLVVDLFLLVGDLERARALLDDTRALCDALQATGEGNQYAAAYALKQAWLALEEDRPADALARLPAGELPRVEDRCARAWIGTAAARRLGDQPQAQRHLAAVTLADPMPTDQIVPWLREALALAEAGSAAGRALADRARELIAANRVPALFSAGLAQALERHPPGA